MIFEGYILADHSMSLKQPSVRLASQASSKNSSKSKEKHVSEGEEDVGLSPSPTQIHESLCLICDQEMVEDEREAHNELD